MKFLRKIFIIIILIVSLGVFYFITVLIINTINDYKPNNRFSILSSNDIINRDTLCLFFWNIGYAGMGKNMDFFYDGGKVVRPPFDYYRQCFDSIYRILDSIDNHTDICLLQEVDFDSKRSYFINQKQLLTKAFESKSYSDSLINYQVSFVAFPLFNPLGKVSAGLVNFSRIKPVFKSEVYLGNTYSWPKQIFFLDRGILIHAYKTHRGKLLYVINIHLSAFDDAIEARAKELNILKTVISIILKKNDYLIVAGDWNINPPKFQFANNLNIVQFYTEPNYFNFLNTNFYYDKFVPTNRKANTPYYKGITPVTTIDYILVSNNLEVMNYKALNFDFNFSDHNPVFFCVVLK